jgi:hypothetical protein
MRKLVAIQFLLVQAWVLTGYASTRSTWPEKGSLLYISKALYPDYGLPRGDSSTADFVTGRSERNPITSGAASNPPSLDLPACEPVVVQAVKKQSLKVRWLRDTQTMSTLGKDWRSEVHRSKEECLEVVKALKRGQ